MELLRGEGQIVCKTFSAPKSWPHVVGTMSGGTAGRVLSTTFAWLCKRTTKWQNWALNPGPFYPMPPSVLWDALCSLFPVKLHSAVITCRFDLHLFASFLCLVSTKRQKSGVRLGFGVDRRFWL